jgi:hypothetical protein
MEWVLECALLGLLAATLFHAIRLERALGVLKRDRAELEGLVSQFNASTRQAELGIERLRAAADGAGRQMARQTELGSALKDDLTFLTGRGEQLADRLEALVRTARPLAHDAPEPAEWARPRPVAVADDRAEAAEAQHRAPASFPVAAPAPLWPVLEESPPRVRSQAERDLLKALRRAR